MASMEIVKRLTPAAFSRTPMTKSEFIEIASACEAYWIHDRDPKRPHAQLSSGLCSNGYLNLMKILQYSNLSQILAHALVWNMPEGINLDEIDWVFGSAYTATGLAKDVANMLDAQWAPLQKKSDGTQLLTHAVPQKGDTILHVEDIVTTAKSTLSADSALRKAGPHANVIPYVPALAFRPSSETTPFQMFREKDLLVHPLFEFLEFWVSSRETCPLCQAGSTALPPKASWKQFAQT